MLVLRLSLPCFIFVVAFGWPNEELHAAELQQIEVAIGKGSALVTCRESVAGVSRNRAGIVTFQSYGKLLKKLRAKQRNSSSVRTRKKLQRTRKLRRLGNRACRNLRSAEPSPSPEASATPSLEASPSPSPSSTPGGPSSPSPSPSPTASPTPSYFADNGDVTELGREVFQIPSDLSSNWIVGEVAFTTYGCTDCHVKRAKPTYPELLVSIRDDMGFSEAEISNQSVSDLLAFLNLSRSPDRE